MERWICNILRFAFVLCMCVTIGCDAANDDVSRVTPSAQKSSIPRQKTSAKQNTDGIHRQKSAKNVASQGVASVRIAAMSPAVAVVLRDLGMAGQIVARHGWDLVLDPAIPVVGDQAGIDYEQLLRVAPTHVVLEWGDRPLPPRLAQLAAQRGWVVESVELLSIDDVLAAPERIAKLFVSKDASWDEQWNASRRPSKLVYAMKDALRPILPEIAAAVGDVLPVYFTDPTGVAGPGSLHYQMLDKLGVAQAKACNTAYAEIDPEDLRRLDPATIVVFSPVAVGVSDEDRLATRATRLTAAVKPWSRLGLRAVREGRVVLIDHPLCLQGATSLADTANELRAALEQVAIKKDAGMQAVVDRWIADLASDNVRWNAIEAWMKLRTLGAAVTGKLEAVLDSSDWQQRQIAADLLRRIPSYTPSRQMLEVCVEGLANDKLPVDRGARHGRGGGATYTPIWSAADGATYLFKHAAGVEDLLVAGMESKDWQQRFLCAVVLGRGKCVTGLPRAVEILMPHLRDNDMKGDALVAAGALFGFGDAITPYVKAALPAADTQQRMLLKLILLDVHQPPAPWDVRLESRRGMQHATGLTHDPIWKFDRYWEGWRVAVLHRLRHKASNSRVEGAESR